MLMRSSAWLEGRRREDIKGWRDVGTKNDDQETEEDDDDDERSFEGRHSPGWKNQRRRGQARRPEADARHALEAIDETELNRAMSRGCTASIGPIAAACLGSCTALYYGSPQAYRAAPSAHSGRSDHHRRALEATKQLLRALKGH
ncbi:hypothetical protein THAR02_06685 [Trichoderma harzianum]|uniref:Uncharacterized protein n=1 Tax=Trichoderma harzianum TaxID=5544 RepID=A0A0F9XLI3_TRIHA|nr:hypothetical protein THAR02_06685 [Trichoderma harzianum]